MFVNRFLSSRHHRQSLLQQIVVPMSLNLSPEFLHQARTVSPKSVTQFPVGVVQQEL